MVAILLESGEKAKLYTPLLWPKMNKIKSSESKKKITGIGFNFKREIAEIIRKT